MEEKKIMTLRKYIMNPDIYKTGSMNIGTTEMALRERYLKMIKKHKKLKYNKFTKDDNIFIHLQIPSETVEDNMYYDVIIKFMSGNGKIETNEIKFYSNIASFTFYHGYVYNKYDLVIEEFKEIIDTEMLEDSPLKTNKSETLTFDKSIYFACRYLYNHSDILYSKDNLKSIKNILEIDTVHKKVAERQSKLKKQKDAKKKEELKNKTSPRISLSRNGNAKIVSKAKNTKSSVSKISRKKTNSGKSVVSKIKGK